MPDKSDQQPLPVPRRAILHDVPVDKDADRVGVIAHGKCINFSPPVQRCDETVLDGGDLAEDAIQPNEWMPRIRRDKYKYTTRSQNPCNFAQITDWLRQMLQYPTRICPHPQWPPATGSSRSTPQHVASPACALPMMPNQDRCQPYASMDGRVAQPDRRDHSRCPAQRSAPAIVGGQTRRKVRCRLPTRILSTVTLTQFVLLIER